MSTTVTMTLDEIMQLPLPNEEELKMMREAEPAPDEDCPAQTPEQLAKFRPWREARTLRGKFRPAKVMISLRVDSDVLEWYKAQGPRYQTRMNAVLRAAAFREGTDG